MSVLSLTKVRNISKRDLLLTGLMALATYALIQQITNIDFTEVWNAIKSADLVWFMLAFFVAQLILVPNATSMMSAVTAPIPFKPTLILQSAIQFIGLAVPSTASRVATNVAYLKKFKGPYVTAITQGALDSFTGFLVQMTILVIAIIFGDVNLNLKNNINTDWVIVLSIAGGIILIGLIVLYNAKTLRLKLINILKDVIGSFSILAEHPIRLVTLFGSNLLSQLVLGTTMVITAQAFGVDISIATALVIVVSATLLGGIAPVPGGIGVQEAIISAGLVSAGVDQSSAYAMTVSYRLFTFFLPPIWGAFSFRWLTKNKFI